MDSSIAGSTRLASKYSAISEFPKGRKYLISLSFRGKASVRPAQVGGFAVNIVIHGSTAVRGRGDLVAYRWALWKLTAPWTHRTRPPHLGKRCAFSTSSTGPFPSNHSRKTPKGPKIALGNPDRPDVLNRIRRPHRWWVSGTVIAALLGLVVQPSIPILGKPLWGQALDTSKELATLFPDRPVVLVSPELAGTHIQTSLAYLHDVDAILVTREYANPALLERVIVTMLEHGRRVFVLLGAEGFHFEAPSLLLSSPRALNVDLLTLETTRSRVPAAVGVRSTAMTVFQATLRTTSKTTTLHVGTVAEDTLFQLRGFYGAETDPDVGTFRWSGAVATIVIPAESKIRLVLGGGRPEGVAPATVTISVDGQARIRDVVLPNTATTVTLANPRAVDGGRTTITIESTVFNPGELALSDDGRSLGVMLYRVEFADTRR